MVDNAPKMLKHSNDDKIQSDEGNVNNILNEDIAISKISKDISTDDTSKDNKILMVSLLSCDQCDFTTESQEDFNIHNESNVHTFKDKVAPEIEVNSSIDTFKEETDVVIQDLPYICGECGKSFATFLDGEEHTLSHISRK